MYFTKYGTIFKLHNYSQALFEEQIYREAVATQSPVLLQPWEATHTKFQLQRVCARTGCFTGSDLQNSSNRNAVRHRYERR